MKPFPDESQMPRSEDKTEPIRGGSVGLNRILGMFVNAVNEDKKPRFSAVLINAFTIFRNVWGMETFPTMQSVEQGFVTDLNLFLEYFDTYLSHVRNHRLQEGRYAPVIVYFPDYNHVSKELLKEYTGKRGELMGMYKIFLSRRQGEMGMVKTTDHLRCFFVKAGPATYPHKELMVKFRDISNRADSLYARGDPVGIISHIPLDLHLSYRLRNLLLVESYTGRVRPQIDFIYKIDKEGRVPFLPSTHVVLGDSDLLASQVSPKIKRQVLQTAVDERWKTRSETDVIRRLSEITQIPLTTFLRYDFN